MALPNIFNSETTEIILKRLENLDANSQPKWGKMNVSQMLAHLNIAYDITFGKIESKPTFFIKLLMKLFIKNGIINEKPYPQNSRTAPEFVITNKKDFEKEKSKYIVNLRETEAKGAIYFEGKENPSMGKLTAKEWNNMFYKHTNHHFEQFGI
jgi:hypothetical protein